MNIASLSGGLDSSIMWLFLTGYLKGAPRTENIMGVFTDPGREDDRTYQMLDTIEAMGGRPIVRIQGPTWEQALEAHSWFLPYRRARWCTPTFKIRPLEAFIQNETVSSYIGLRADEQERTGYLGDKGTNITPRYILREMGITRADIESEARRIGLPPAGQWSCDCCPFKNMILWVELIEQYPERAEWCAWVEEEKERRGAGSYGWIKGYKIRQLIDNHITRAEIRSRWNAKHSTNEQLSLFDDDIEDNSPCLMCRVK